MNADTLYYNIENLKRIAVALLLLLLALPMKPQNPSPKYEVRAVWLTTIGGLDWPSSYARSPLSIQKQQQELKDILDRLKAANINTVLLQTRVRGTTIYPSLYEPWDGCLSGQPGVSPGYDALQFAIDECHKRGMELHAWIVTIPVGKWNKLGCSRLRQKHPRMIRRIGNEGFMNPEYDETGNYLAKICREVTDRYDVDGIHLDYIRYPEAWKMQISRSQGRNNITNIVKKIHTTVKASKPWVKVSCSPIGKFDDLTRYWSRGWNAYTKVCQDAQGWLRDGLMDALFPMMYFQDNQFYPFALDWKENDYGRIICAGLGIYFLSPKEKDWSLDIIQRKMNVLRQQGIGHAYFRSKFFTDNTKGIYDFAKGDIDRHPALIPPMTWESKAKPSAPKTVRLSRKNSVLEWSGATDRSNSNRLIYNVYASPHYPVDINDGANLIATRLTQTQIAVGRKTALHFAVTATDRYGNESAPCMTEAPADSYHLSGVLLENDGKMLILPPKGQSLDADLVVIEDMTGRPVATRIYDKKASVSQLPEGMYAVKSLGRKKVMHRLGYFIIRRK